MSILHNGTPVTPDSVIALTGAGLRDVLTERVRQIDVEKFTLAHDLGHHPGEIALALASYANTAIDQLHGREHPRDQMPETWPWQGEAWRCGTARKNLVKAGALLLAVLDRIDGAAQAPGSGLSNWPADCVVCLRPAVFLRHTGGTARPPEPFCSRACQDSLDRAAG